MSSVELVVARDAVERRLQFLGALALRDVRDAAADETARRRGQPDQADLAGYLGATRVAMDPLEDRRLPVERPVDVGGDRGGRGAAVGLLGRRKRDGVGLEKGLVRHSPEPQGVVVGLHEPARVHVEDDDRLGRVLDLRPVAGLALLQGFLGEPPVRDVDRRSDVALEVSLRREPGDARVEDPAVLAVAPAQAVFELVRFAARLDLVEGAHERELVRVNALHPAVPDLLLERPPREVEPRLVEEGAAGGRIRDPDEHGRRVRHEPEPRLALLQGLFGAQTLRQVRGNSENLVGAAVFADDRPLDRLEPADASGRVGDLLLGNHHFAPGVHDGEIRAPESRDLVAVGIEVGVGAVR